ncbi:hypothetical protein Droror1_Dr00008697 [Drosera rotundifolia]
MKITPKSGDSQTRHIEGNGLSGDPAPVRVGVLLKELLKGYGVCDCVAWGMELVSRLCSRSVRNRVGAARADVDEEWFLVMILMVTCGGTSWIKGFEASCNGCCLGRSSLWSLIRYERISVQAAVRFGANRAATHGRKLGGTAAGPRLGSPKLGFGLAWLGFELTGETASPANKWQGGWRRRIGK